MFRLKTGTPIVCGVSFLLATGLFWGNGEVSAAAPLDQRGAAMAQRIDALLAEGWAKAGATPAAPADDAEFLRRASIDLTGIIPTVSDVRAFLSDQRPDKRAHWINLLLDKPSHATHLANTWRSVMLQDREQEKFRGINTFQSWLREQFADNVSYDKMVSSLLQATGNGVGPTWYYAALELKPDELATSTSRMFLGVQLQCAECHDHPFDRWKKDDFWSFAAFFARIRQPATAQQFSYQVFDAPEGEVTLPDTDRVIPPRFLGSDKAVQDSDGNRRAQLAAWLTSRDNPYFARAAVNRVWALLFGRGLVEPVDDLGGRNVPSHPQLLDELAGYFAETGFDLRELFRMLANTRAYQLGSESATESPPPPESFACMAIKSFTAEQLYDCLAEATRRRESGQQFAQFAGASSFDPGRQAFIARFQAPTQGATEFQSGIPQALTMMNGALVADATDLSKSDLLVALDAPFFTVDEKIEVLYLSTLSRLPRDDERQRISSYLAAGGPTGDARKALGDVLWAILNSAEFVLNH